MGENRTRDKRLLVRCGFNEAVRAWKYAGKMDGLLSWVLAAFELLSKAVWIFYWKRVYDL